MPEISVLMSVYNGEAYLKQAIDSILNQTYSDFELIIVDDGSTDRTDEIIQTYADPRIRIFRFEQNRGVGAALQFGLGKTRGKYIAKADADDINVPTRLQTQKDFLDRHPDIALVKGLISYFPHDRETAESTRYKQMKAFREQYKNQVVATEDLAEKIYWTCCIPHTTIMARSSVMKEMDYDPNLRIAEDYKLFYEMNKRGYKMATVEEVLVHMRVTTDSTTVREDFRFYKCVYEIKKEEIIRLSEKGKRFFLWGAGSKGEELVRNVLPAGDLNIHGFIDSDSKKQNRVIAGYPVYPPDILKAGDTVLITSAPGMYEIGDELKRRGFQPLRDFIGFC